MLASNIVSIVWLMLTIVISGILCSIIYKHISSRSPINQTIIEFIYLDCIIYIYFLTVSQSVTFIACLCSDQYILDFHSAWVCSTIVYFFISCNTISLAISACLRQVCAIIFIRSLGPIGSWYQYCTLAKFNYLSSWPMVLLHTFGFRLERYKPLTNLVLVSIWKTLFGGFLDLNV